ncbi:Na/Pi cotransporter family protein [Alkalitalea saponilacus]|uniref:Phosphate:Na+ symporter n=1 Tax=Alkalitalea saponilacus TaxID=889453 RepID=A0A1T5DCI6_9BACT|nr:Na/Pi cotransporter family protein [Alkalitalea saponilacus]ASB50661.1 Na/Pi cotransporter II-like protein [Alkalitalea saponilacus]SKB69395.1 phosphate:Na+ symporter [Alkalitalea saponilacus]
MEEFITFIAVFGGLGIFLLGMDLLSSGTKSLAGARLRQLLDSFLKNKAGGVGFGVILTLLFQSSSAASVVLVGFVDASLITFKQTLPVLLGTGIGTTITTQLISFNVGNFALLFVGLGFFIRNFAKGGWKHGGQIILGFGVLFFGMKLMSDGMEPLRDNDQFINALLYLENPLAGMAAGMMFTALIQSSAAFIGILITLCNSGLLSFEASLPLILGTNIGTTVTALLAAMTASYPGRKLAVANALFRLIGALIFIWLLTPWASLTAAISGQAASNARLLANAHTIFNFLMAFTMLPATGLIGKLAEKLVPVPKEKPVHALQHLNKDLLSSPELSMPFLQKEIEDMGNLVYKMVERCMDPFFHRDEKAIKQIRTWEEKTDFYREEINQFLVKLNESKPMETWSEEVFRLMHVVNELEQVADIVSVNIIRQGEKWLHNRIDFSPDGKKELENYHQRCLKQLERALILMHNWDQNQALKMKRKYRKYALMAFDLERRHYKRLLSPNTLSLESSKMHMELLNLLRIINSRATNFGRLVFMSEELE